MSRMKRSTSLPTPIRKRAKVLPEKCEAVFRQEARKSKNLEPAFDSIKSGGALGAFAFAQAGATRMGGSIFCAGV